MIGKAQFATCKAAAKLSLEALKEFKARTDIPQEWLPMFDEKMHTSIEDLEETLANQEAKANIASDIDPAILIEYNTRKEQIVEYQKRLDIKIQVLDDLRVGMLKVKADWIIVIDEITATISTTFSRLFDCIGCAGEVKVNKEGDYADWGIEIWVKFR